MPVDEDLPASRLIGRYELLGKIAAGGMATVYLGRVRGARGFERVVAVKKLHATLEANAEIVSMFSAEARVAARIRHPNVVPTLDVDDRDGLCLVMEYVEGDQLLGLLRAAAESETRIPPEVALRIGIDALNGLHAAHELTNDEGKSLRIVHRDVSPHNILVGIDGITKLTDFGIAKVDDTVTAANAGELKGKLAYMAPEQARRERIDRRADVFSVGIVIWEMFATRRLFLGKTSSETLAAVLVSPIPNLTTEANVPEGLASVVARALERDPAKRWQNAADFAEALERQAASVGGVAPARRVAEYVMAVSGEKIAEERTRLRQAAKTAAPAPPSPASSSPATPSPDLETREAGTLSASLADSTGASATRSVVPTLPSTGKGTARAALAVASLAVVFGVASFVTRAPTPTPAANAAAANVDTNAAAVPPSAAIAPSESASAAVVVPAPSGSSANAGEKGGTPSSNGGVRPARNTNANANANVNVSAKKASAAGAAPGAAPGMTGGTDEPLPKNPYRH
ncbi:serine/threonine protein kinase [Labilithrix luteola]|uniref:Serine/threonine protein kinase n=1 Tax=Labilithrix luteola TaxID=1391654 RepID=A0A0K1PRF5_9BACT|nr:serine/threonine-protein kinase [Labilithrix luteola]AKU96102.1 serine/threonine protein kinase [Labilithrix luteola]